MPLTQEQRDLIARQYGLRVDDMTDEQIRAAIGALGDFCRRSAGIEPATANADKLTVDSVLATEAPCLMFDYTRWEPVDEILLMSGCDLKSVRKKKLPLLDTHTRDTTKNVLGSVTNLRIEADLLLGTDTFSSINKADFVKVQEGHLDQRSIGYRVKAAMYVEPGETAQVNGRTFTASASRALRIATTWLPVESSVVPLAADPAAGTRAAEASEPAASATVPASSTPTSTTTTTQSTPTQPQQSTRKETPAMKLTPEQMAYIRKAMNNPKATDDEVRAYAAENPDVLVDFGRSQVKPQAPAPVVPPPAANDEGRQALAELQRRDAIAAAGAAYPNVDGIRELVDANIAKKDSTVETFRAALIDMLAKRTPSRVQVMREDADVLRECATEAILQRANPSFKVTDEQRAKAGKFRGFALVDLARHCLELTGASTRGMSRMELVGRAFLASGDFQHILSSTANKALIAAYAAAPMTWTRWARRGSLSDFKATPRVQMTQAGVLPSVPEGAEFGSYAVSDTAENIQLGTYGKIFPITRQAVINDDLDAFGRIPQQHARAWARTINQVAVKVLLTNAALHDGNALYFARTSGGSSNLDTSVTTVTTKATAEAVIRKLRALIAAQKDGDGSSYLQLQMALLLTGPTLAPFFVQAVYETNNADNRKVDIARMGLDVLEEPEIENSSLTGYGINVTFGFVNPADAAAVEVAFLDGNDAPTLETQEDFTVDGVRYKVRGDVGAKAIDFRPTAKHVL
jgi:hypothetical protein